MTDDDMHSIGGQFRRSREEIRSINEELAGIAQDMRDIARTEMELARAEIREQISYTKTAAIFGGIAAVMGLITLIFASTALMLGLDEAIPLWAAALITFAVLLVITAIAGGVAYSAVKKLTVVPTKTMSSVREDMRWARDQMKSSMTLSGSETP